MQDIIPQDDDQSSMTEDIKLVQDGKNFSQLKVTIFVTIQFLVKKVVKHYAAKANHCYRHGQFEVSYLKTKDNESWMRFLFS